MLDILVRFSMSKTLIQYSAFLRTRQSFATDPLGASRQPLEPPTPPGLKYLNPLLFSGIVQIILVYTKNVSRQLQTTFVRPQTFFYDVQSR